MSPRTRNLLRHAEDLACAVLIVAMFAMLMGLDAMLTTPGP